MSQADVIIVGGGPTGITAGLILGRYGVKTVIFDKLKDIFPHPRAAVFDDDIARVYQTASVAEDVLKVTAPSKGYQFLDQENNVMFSFKRTADRTLHGYPTSLVIRQPEVEEQLRKGLSKFESVSFYPNHEVIALEQTDTHVIVTVKDNDTKEEKKYEAKYLLAADGANSIIREIVGIERDDFGFQHPWFILDVKAPNGLNVTNINQQFCHPKRPCTFLYLGNNWYRFEIALLEGESQSTYKTDEQIKELLSNWIDTSDIEIDRRIVYVFRSRIAKARKSGRVFLIGDAAHQMPPFLGQGLSSGARDAANIAWKIAHVLQHNVKEDILDTYESERLPHVKKIIQQAVQLGEIIQTDNQEIADFRDRLFKFLNGIPNVSEALHNLQRSMSPIGEGFFHPSLDGKDYLPFPQPVVTLANGSEEKLDDVLGLGFALVASKYVNNTKFNQLKEKVEQLGLGKFLKCIHLVDDTPANSDEVKEEAAMLDDWFNNNRVDVAIVRPDHYVYAKTSADQAEAILEDLKNALL